MGAERSRVSVIGDWNGWNAEAHPLAPRGDGSGSWEGHVGEARAGQAYKYRIVARRRPRRSTRPIRSRFFAEAPPATASRVWDLDYEWGDDEWMAHARARNALDAPMSIYEVHLGSWRRDARRQRAPTLPRASPSRSPTTSRRMGFTHVELMPVTEHPFYGSWGYQTTGYFAPTARYGTPQDFMYLVDVLHQRGIGVILDWVPSHFPERRARARVTSTARISTSTPIRARASTPSGTASSSTTAATRCARSSLVSALFWLERYHVDGLRVDAVASMLYLDYARKAGEWIPNEYGGKREPRGDRVPAPAQRGGLPRSSRRADDRRGVDRVADGLAAGRTSAASASA